MPDRPSQSARAAAHAAHAAAHAAHRARVAAQKAHAAQSAPTGKTGGASFASLLAGAGDTPTVSTTPPETTPTTGTTVTTADGRPPVHLRKHERMTEVEHQQYGEIHGGRRDGMFVNLSGNKRRGQAFTIVTRQGREMHIYGSGKDRLVVRVSPPRNPAQPPPPIKLHDGETMTPVPGHHYARIHGGPRDGLLINTSRNHNRGKTFAAVTKDGVDYHIYGTGKDRRVIRMVPHDPGATITS